MITVHVDADEVTPNTEYTCNITGRVPAFTGVQLGKSFLATRQASGAHLQEGI